MPIRFAASLKRTSCRMTRYRVRSLQLRPANDNIGKRVESRHLHAALHHFSQHGLAAADHARQQALAAANAGDRETFQWWLEICRALDRRMAGRIDKSLQAEA